jgi:protein-S-isoprenylcysteine O-methyltransferase Ste14
VTKPVAIAGSAAFLLMPGLVAGYVPWSLTGWRSNAAVTSPLLVGGGRCVIALGVALLLACFAQFALQGLGTPSPVAPTKTLVVRGAYRYVRNPMYIAVIAIVIGQALVFQAWILVAYALCIWVATYAFVVFYEEPTLRKSYGQQYVEYCARVARWLPRFPSA